MEHLEVEYDLKIRIAGNTEIPCFSAIKDKGYEVTLTYYEGDDYPDWEAVKDNRLFSATNPIELLGLIAMWEVRGDDWCANSNDHKEYNELCDNAPVYYGDENGNLHRIEKNND
jgi:hypothetical protein